MIRGQSYKTFYTSGQICKLVLKLDNMLWLGKYLVRILGHYTFKCSQSNFFHRVTIGNLGTLFYTSQRLKLLHRIGPWALVAWRNEYLTGFFYSVTVPKTSTVQQPRFGSRPVETRFFTQPELELSCRVLRPGKTYSVFSFKCDCFELYCNLVTGGLFIKHRQSNLLLAGCYPWINDVDRIWV